jgi:hypothetical protein
MNQIQTDIIHRGNTIWGANECAVKNDDQKLIYRVYENCRGIFDEHKTVIINGEEFESTEYGKYNYPVSKIEMGYEKPIFYRGSWYVISGYRAVTQEEVSDTHNQLSHHWTDLVIEYSDWDELIKDNMMGEVYLLCGHSLNIKRKITLAELQMSYKKIEEMAKTLDQDCSRPLRWWRVLVSSFLMIDEDRYVSGRYDINTQIIKRLHAKINHKTKTK